MVKFGGPGRGRKKGAAAAVEDDRVAARREFRDISREVFEFGKHCDTMTDEFKEKFGSGEHHFGTRASSVWDAMPNKDIDLNKGRKRVRVPYNMVQRSREKKRIAAEKAAAQAAPVEDDPVHSAEMLRRRERRAQGLSDRRPAPPGQTYADLIRKRAGDRSGMRGIGSGERGYKATGIGKFDAESGILHIRDFELGGLRKAQRVIDARKKGKSLQAAMASVNAGTAGKTKRKPIGWKRKGQAKRRR